jgi:glucan phosphoethanolaminetransferase (alkaline phosphatase superfamily)
MLILYTLIGIVIYICFALIFAKLNFKKNLKKYILLVLSVIYNGFIGYIDTYVILLLYGYFANMPKGSGYEVPESEAGFNAILGLVTLTIYLLLLIPINIYMKKKGRISKKTYIIANIIATILGIIIFWVFLDKNKILF